MEHAHLEKLVQDLGATNVTLAPGVPSSQIGDVFAAADVLALHLIKDPLFAITIPSKTQFYLAMGKPILIGVEGEAAGLVVDVGAGIGVPPENVEAMADAMVRIALLPKAAMDEMAENAYRAYWQEGSQSRGLEALEAIFRDANGRF